MIPIRTSRWPGLIKTRAYETELWSLFSDYARTGDFTGLRVYLLGRSGLPGPRGNLELAKAFGNVIQQGILAGALEPQSLLSLCQSLSSFPASLAPTNDPKEFLVFCGLCGLGALGTKPPLFDPVSVSLRTFAGDPRWRAREGVAMALQRLLDAEPKQTLVLLLRWVNEDDPFLLRAVVAGVAEPRILVSKATARSALELHKRVFNRFTQLQRNSEGFDALKKGLGYSLSVVVAALPREGFAFMAELAASRNADVNWVIRENLKKKRLMRYPADVAAVYKALSVSLRS